MDSDKVATSSVVFVLIAWLLIMGAGVIYTIDYQTTPGLLGEPPEYWPLDTEISWNQNKSNMLVFLHPKCPCSLATLAELSKIMTSTVEKVTPHIVFFQPKDRPQQWHKDRLFKIAKEIPKAQIFVDKSGIESDRFKAHTSGSIAYYNQSKNLEFFGGITSSRGHEGDNYGSLALKDKILGKPTNIKSALVYGCPIKGKNKQCALKKVKNGEDCHVKQL